MPETKIPLKLLVYDLDDTLYPERDYIFSGFGAVAQAHADLLGDPQRATARLQEIFEAGNRTRSFNQLLEEQGRQPSAELIARLVETFRAHRPRISLHPDAAASLDFWRRRVHTAILSDGYLIAQQNKIAALGLADRVDEVVLTDRWGREFWKPHPRAFRHLQDRFSVPGRLCAYVSDNPAKDFIAPNGLDWRTILIRRPGGTYEHESPPPDGRPHLTIPDLGELPHHLEPA